jgi:transposase InsO family protein
VVVEMRRKHPRWGAKRIRMQLLKAGGDAVVPAERTINRILSRHGLLDHKARKRRRESFKRWQREAPMQLWQMDIVGGVMIVDAATGGLREAKLVTGVDDHSRYCVIGQVVARPTGRAVCLALAEALAKFGVPEEILTDNGKQFTARFGNGGEVLFDKICRLNAIAHRLTAPASPTTTGKVCEDPTASTPKSSTHCSTAWSSTTPKSSTTNSESGRTTTTTIAPTVASTAKLPTNDYARKPRPGRNR